MFEPVEDENEDATKEFVKEVFKGTLSVSRYATIMSIFEPVIQFKILF